MASNPNIADTKRRVSLAGQAAATPQTSARWLRNVGDESESLNYGFAAQFGRLIATLIGTRRSVDIPLGAYAPNGPSPMCDVGAEWIGASQKRCR